MTTQISSTGVVEAGNSIRVLGKGNKERFVYFGKRTSRALWKYIMYRLSDDWVVG